MRLVLETHTRIHSLGASAEVDPFAIYFTHNAISSHFRNGDLIDDAIEQILNGHVLPDVFPPLEVVPYDGKLYSLSNRRLFMFRVLSRKESGESLHSCIRACNASVFSQRAQDTAGKAIQIMAGLDGGANGFDAQRPLVKFQSGANIDTRSAAQRSESSSSAAPLSERIPPHRKMLSNQSSPACTANACNKKQKEDSGRGFATGLPKPAAAAAPITVGVQSVSNSWRAQESSNSRSINSLEDFANSVPWTSRERSDNDASCSNQHCSNKSSASGQPECSNLFPRISGPMTHTDSDVADFTVPTTQDLRRSATRVSPLHLSGTGIKT